MGRYRYAISYESDTQPVETVRGEFEAPRFTTALYRGGKVARDNWPRKRRFRSVVTRYEIEFMREHERAADGRREAEAYSMGEFWGAREFH